MIFRSCNAGVGESSKFSNAFKLLVENCSFSIAYIMRLQGGLTVYYYQDVPTNYDRDCRSSNLYTFPQDGFHQSQI